LPGPGDYLTEKAMQAQNEKRFVKHSTVFASNIDRFKMPADWIPGPGQYTSKNNLSMRS
jgi:hypothetical protein